MAMAPHLEPKELDNMRKWLGRGVPPVTIHARVAASRLRRDMDAPHLTNVRKVLAGKAHDIYVCTALGEFHKTIKNNHKTIIRQS